MCWWIGFIASLVLLIVAVIAVFVFSGTRLIKGKKIKLSYIIKGGVIFLAVLAMFLPVHKAAGEGVKGFFLSIFYSMQLLGLDAGFEDIAICAPACYQIWASIVFCVAPVLTFGFVLTLFKDVYSSCRLWLCLHCRKAFYVFSELNDKSLALASDIKAKNKKAVIVFTDVFERNEEKIYELIEQAEILGAICFKKDILVLRFLKGTNKSVSFFTIGSNETENLNQGLKLIEKYNDRDNTHVYIFSTKIESELLLTAANKGKVKVRRVNEVRSLINRILYENGEIIFDSAKVREEGEKLISAVVIGMGNHGTEMVKALSWFGQMDGYKLEINAFDRDPLAEEKFVALAPELMSPKYNGVYVEGEAQYKIEIHPDVDVQSISFVNKIKQITDTTYVFVALGNDDINVKTAVDLRMHFERMNIHPKIQTVVYDTHQKKALEGIRNFKKQDYDIEFVGDIESSYAESVIIDSELENDALQRHLKYGEEEEFWTYEYNYRSSVASAIHMKARIKCGILGADKAEGELTEEERNTIEALEHRRWNAYMRSEGYVFSGSKDKSSRNDLAKMHHDLVDFSSLSDEDKRKDSRVGTK